jgi:hypothetical protein
MLPYSDTIDGPLMQAARKALETDNINWILPWLPVSAEQELRMVFVAVHRVRGIDTAVRALADQWFLETTI